jgi:hypothetical protein
MCFIQLRYVHTETNQCVTHKNCLLQTYVSARVTTSSSRTRLYKEKIYKYVYGIITNWYLNFVTIIIFKSYIMKRFIKTSVMMACHFCSGINCRQPRVFQYIKNIRLFTQNKKGYKTVRNSNIF